MTRRTLKPAPKRPCLEKLLERARKHVMTPKEKFEQRVSWIYGEMGLAGHKITKTQIRKYLLRP